MLRVRVSRPSGCEASERSIEETAPVGCGREGAAPLAEGSPEPSSSAEVGAAVGAELGRLPETFPEAAFVGAPLAPLDPAASAPADGAPRTSLTPVGRSAAA